MLFIAGSMTEGPEARHLSLPAEGMVRCNRKDCGAHVLHIGVQSIANAAGGPRSVALLASFTVLFVTALFHA